MTELVLDPFEITRADIPLYERVAFAFLLRYRNALTAKGYTRSLKQWFAWCASRDLDPLQARRVHIEGWARLLEADGNKASTVASKLNALTGYYRYALAEELIEKNPAQLIDRPKVPRESSRNGVTRFELDACLTVAEKMGPRAHALICLLGLQGFRISEALGIDVDHLGEQGPYPTVRILRKGGKWQVQPLSYRSRYAITALVGDRTDGPLFVTRHGNRLMRQQAHRLVVRIAERAGITKVVSPHSFRHGFVTIALNAGIPTRDIRGATGHSDDRMIAYYDRETLNLARSAVHSLEAFVAAVQ